MPMCPPVILVGGHIGIFLKLEEKITLTLCGRCKRNNGLVQSTDARIPTVEATGGATDAPTAVATELPTSAVQHTATLRWTKAADAAGRSRERGRQSRA